MRFLWIFIIFPATLATNIEIFEKEFLDLSNSEDNVILWKNLFLKLNTVLSKTLKLEEDLENIKKRLDSQHSWTTILRRQDGTVSFNRSWNEYGNGFGDPNGEYFMGLQRIHELTTYGPPQELMIILKDFDGQTRYAKYDRFRIGSEAEKYALLELGQYNGDAGDDFSIHRGHKFTTPDQDNDDNETRNNGAVFQGGWWFFGLGYHGYLNGPYRSQGNSNGFGISWHSFRLWNHSLKYAEMRIRPKL
uniref:Fibrinogen C-terminal domain-containing protein n=1 Tax=Stomoxys calcitrans TaxID=35570 RepID=A0A1I8PRP3_STOCA